MRAPAGGRRSAGDVLRPVWAEVNLTHIKENVKRINTLGENRSLMAVVKANAYGHGSVAVARVAIAAGAMWLGVATPEEGIVLRQAGIKAPILVLGAFFPGQEQAFLDYQLTATAATEEAVAALCRLASRQRSFSVHIKVDTGMGRLGLLEQNVVPMAQAMAARGVHVDGLYTHLARADEQDLAFANRQLQRFQQTRQALAANGLRPRWLHVGNSAALFRLPMEDLNLVRVGIAVYGLYPSEYVPHNLPLLPALSLHARAVAVRRLPAGSPISYGGTYITTKETNIVTLPLGYADGFSRLLSHKTHALMGGKRFPIVGNIAMDQCMVDVGDYEAQVGEEAVLLGKQGDEEISAEELAAAMGTINYEVICMISARVPRMYISTP